MINAERFLGYVDVLAVYAVLLLQWLPTSSLSHRCRLVWGSRVIDSVPEVPLHMLSELVNALSGTTACHVVTSKY